MASQKPDFDDLEKLGNRIYDRDFPDISNFPEPKLSHDAGNGPKRWRDTDELFADPAGQRPGRGFPFKALFIGAIVFFLVCASIAGVIIYRGLNTVSNSNVDVSFLGPVTVAAGTPLNFSVVVKNNNQAAMENATLYLSYPSGTVEATDTKVAFLHESGTLGNINSGMSAMYDAHVVLYGAEHATETITATIQYSIPNSNALYQKKETYTVGISSAPLLMSVNAPSQTPAGAPVTFTLTLATNSSNPPGNILVTALYPFGFQFATATPTPTYNNSEWLFPTIDASSTQTITITGYLQGQENDQQTIHFLVGTQSQNDPQKINVIYLADSQVLTIKRSPIALNLSLGGSANGSNGVITPGLANGTLVVTNNLPADLLNTQVALQFSGNALDSTSISPGENGIYRQNDQTVTWDRLSVPALGSLSPGEQVSVDFNFSTLPANLLAGITDGSITISANVSGQESGSAADAAPISATGALSERLMSTVNLLAHAVYSTGPFTNSGPVPPRVDTPTSYTVLWTLTNTSNTVFGGTVTATLPPYVTWLGQVSPSTAGVTFDATTNTVTWSPGTLPAGGAAPVASVAFQIQVDPTVSQVGTAPDILDNINFSGMDAFTGVSVTASANSLSTAITTDPAYGGETGFVQQ